MGSAALWAVVAVCATAGWIATTWIRTRTGRIDAGKGDSAERAAHDAQQALDEALASRDARIDDLEERIRVLERIVVDQSRRLGEEIDRLGA